LIYLILSVLSSVIIFVVFKIFSKYNVNTFHAIVVNYVVACASGVTAYENSIKVTEISSYEWFYLSLALGSLFIIVFNLMALTTQRSGLSVVSVATKMSVVIPIIFGLVYYKESFGAIKIAGVFLALIAVYLSSTKTKDGLTVSRKDFIFPLLVFIGSGIIDTSLKFLENSFVAENDVPLFSATIFGAAACIGIIVIIFQAIKGDFSFQLKNIVGGIVLGIPNYFSIYFLVKALRSDLLDSSGIFTINNVAVVMVSTFFGILFFKEKLSTSNWFGMFLAVISIFLVTLAGF
jgi:drug/metabolite transporter (DMT)-like permease